MTDLIVIAVLGFVAGACLSFALCARLARSALIAYTIRAGIAGARAHAAAVERSIQHDAPGARVFTSERDAIAFAEKESRRA